MRSIFKKKIGIMLISAGVLILGGCAGRTEPEPMDTLVESIVEDGTDTESGTEAGDATNPENISNSESIGVTEGTAGTSENAIDLSSVQIVISSANDVTDSETVTMSYAQLKNHLKNTDSSQGELVVKISGDTQNEEIASILSREYGGFLNGDFAEGYVIKRIDGRCFFLLVYDAPADYETWIFELTEKGSKYCSLLSGKITGNDLSSDKIEAEFVFHMLGTYYATMNYYMGEDGELVRAEENFVFEETKGNNYELTVARKLPVILNGESSILAPGTKIKITGSNFKDEISFVLLQTKETGTILYNWGVGDMIYIDYVSEFDYFETLPYVQTVSAEDASEPMLVIKDSNGYNTDNGATGKFVAIMPMSYMELGQYLESNSKSLQGELMLELSMDTGDDAMAAILGANYGWFQGGYIIRHEDGRIFWLLEFDETYTDSNFVVVYEMVGDKMVKCDSLFYYSSLSECESSSRIVVSHLFDMLGTYRAVMEYTLDENGKLIQKEEIYQFAQDEARNMELTVEKDLPVILNGESTTLAPGTQILVEGTNNAGEIYFAVPQTGEKGTIFYQWAQGRYSVYIDGVYETEYFGYYLPYVG